MGQVNLYEQPADFQYLSMPFDEIMRVGDMIQGQEDKAKAEQTALGNITWQNLRKDQEKSYKIREEIDKKINELNERGMKEGFRGKSREILTLKNELERRKSQFGDIGALETSVKAREEYAKNLHKKYMEGKISKDKMERLLSMSDADYQGIGEGNEYGLYNVYSGYDAADDVDIAKQADELAKGWKADKIHNEGWQVHPDNGLLYRKTGQTTEWITDKEIYNAILPQLMADPKNRAYASQEVFMNTHGAPVNENGNYVMRDNRGNLVEVNPNLYSEKIYNDIFDRAASFAATKYSYKDQGYFEDIRDNEYALHMAKKAADERQNVTGHIVEGETTEFPYSENYESLVSDGIITTDANGKVTINKDALFKTIPGKVTPVYGEKGDKGTALASTGKEVNKKAVEKLTVEMNNIAKLIGWKDKVTPDNHQAILDEYNKKLSLRTYDLEQSPFVREQLNKTIDISPNNYTYMFSEDGNFKNKSFMTYNQSEEVKNKKIEIQKRTSFIDENGNKKFAHLGVVKNADGEVIGYVKVRPNSEDEKSHFDPLLQTNHVQLKIAQTPNFGLDNTELASGNLYARALIGNQSQQVAERINSVIQNPILTGMPGTEESPILRDGSRIFVISDASSPLNQIYIRQRSNGSYDKEPYYNFGELLRQVDYEYYQTTYGRNVPIGAKAQEYKATQ